MPKAFIQAICTSDLSDCNFGFDGKSKLALFYKNEKLKDGWILPKAVS